MARLITPPRRRGHEILDDPDCDARLRRRSLADVARSNRLFGGTRAVLAELDAVFCASSGTLTLLDVGTGMGDIPAAARARARRRGVRLVALGVDGAQTLAAAAAARLDGTVQADARRLPFADGSVDLVTCSQLLHHFTEVEAREVVAELHRVARRRVIIADLRRSWLAAAGLWLASFPLRFHPVSRHDGVVSVLRGFTGGELRELVRATTGRTPAVRRRAAFRLTASWTPA
ncbi:MAG TPA: methyltransferase domain-containing protein [Gemmatimonadaceae bacterium]|nr:methyltransferase domain-containing protein [Gemmatimonadaceae bacterium]